MSDTMLAQLRAALADARKAREEALAIASYYDWSPTAYGMAQAAAESAARCEGRLLAMIEAEEAAPRAVNVAIDFTRGEVTDGRA